MSKVEAFRALHHHRAPGDPLVLPGPWDAASARVFTEAGFPALATPSAGVAASLGYEDGQVPADEMFAAVARIVRAVDVPVSADVGGGPPGSSEAESLGEARGSRRRTSWSGCWRWGRSAGTWRTRRTVC